MHTVPTERDDLFLLTPSVPGVVEPMAEREGNHARFSASSTHMNGKAGLGA
jgi:hypothetical protein